ncbi:MAG TPA: hypothetical protein VFZ53_09755 [Polyangiaceae bacterium]
MVQPMIRKQIYLTPAQNARLRKAARRLRRSEAEVLREAIELHLPSANRRRSSVMQDSLFRLIGAGSSSARDLSEHVDDILYGAGGA